MATSSIASLVVSLEANIAKFSTDMQRASADTTKAMNAIQSSARAATTALGALGVALSAGAVMAWAHGVVRAAEALGDLADSTGSSVEDLSKLSNQAKVAGGNFDDFEGALLKFTTKIGDTEDVTSKFSVALKNLGVTASDPATALQQVIVGLDKFANGATKAAYAKEIFGKSGVKFLATLADMAKLQDVSATVTTKQTEEAEKLAQSLRQLSTEATTFQNILLNGVIPQLLEFVKALNAAKTAGAAGFFAGLGITDADRANLQGAIAETVAGIGELQKKKAAFENQGVVVKLFSADDIAILNSQIAVATQRLVQLRAQVKAIPGAADSAGKPPLPKLPGVGGAAGAKQAVTDYADEIDKLNNAMNRMASGTGAAVHMDAALEKISHDLRAGVTMTNDSIDAYVAAARALDKLTQEYKDWDDAMRSAEAAAAKEQQQLLAFQDAQKRNAQSIDEFVLSLDEQTRTMFMSNEEAEKSIALAKLQREYNEGLIPSLEALAQAQEKIGGALDRRNAAAAIKASIEQQKAFAHEINMIFEDAFSDSLTNVVMGTRSVSQAFRDMERNIVSSLSRIASHNIAAAIFGQGSVGGGVPSLFASLLGGSSGGNSFNTMGMSGGLDSFLFSLFGGAADGGALAANQPKFVGEKGKELFVPSTPGVIIPNDVLTTRRAQQSVINISVNVDGATTRATADQVALRTGVAVRRALARNG